MDYRFNDEQTMLKDSLEGWLGRNYQFEQWRKLAARQPSYSEDNWRQFAEMGWLGIGIPEDLGGTGFGFFERMIIGEAFGYRLVNEPYFSSVALCGALLAHGGTSVQKNEWLPRIAAGDAKLAFAFAEKQSRFFLEYVSTTARKTASGWTLSGEKIVVLDAPGADRLIVLARTAGGPQDKAGLSLFLVDPAASGVSTRTYATVDDRRASDLVLDNAMADEMIGIEGEAFGSTDGAVDEAILYLCAEGVGAMQALFDTTLAYVKTRKQFGQPIGDFQVIQHRMVELRVQIESARALTVYAASVMGSDDANERRRAASAAKVQIGKSARVVGRNAVQLHGGMGMTDELSVGHYFKRLLAVETLLGDIDFHQRRFADLPSELA